MRRSTTVRKSAIAFTLVGTLLGAGYLATGSASAETDIKPRNDAEAAARITEAVTGATTGLEQPSSAAASTNVEVPKASDAPVVISSGPTKITMGLPISDGARDAVATTTGTTVYPDASSNVGVAVQTLGPNELRALVAINNSEAPREYRFPMTLPDGARLAEAPDGSGAVQIVADTTDGTVILGTSPRPGRRTPQARLHQPPTGSKETASSRL